jgi:hypothetical protein
LRPHDLGLELGDLGVAVVGILVQRAIDRVNERIGHVVRGEVGERGAVLDRVASTQRRRIAGAKRRTAGDHEEGERADRVDVLAHRRATAEHALGCDRGELHRVVADLVGVDDRSEPEVDDFDDAGTRAATGEDHAGGAEQAVLDPHGVRATDRAAELAQDREDALERQRPAREHRAEVLTEHLAMEEHHTTIGRALHAEERQHVRDAAPAEHAVHCVDACDEEGIAGAVAGRHPLHERRRVSQRLLGDRGERMHPALAGCRTDPVRRTVVAAIVRADLHRRRSMTLAHAGARSRIAPRCAVGARVAGMRSSTATRAHADRCSPRDARYPMFVRVVRSRRRAYRNVSRRRTDAPA